MNPLWENVSAEEQIKLNHSRWMSKFKYKSALDYHREQISTCNAAIIPVNFWVNIVLCSRCRKMNDGNFDEISRKVFTFLRNFYCRPKSCLLEVSLFLDSQRITVRCCVVRQRYTERFGAHHLLLFFVELFSAINFECDQRIKIDSIHNDERIFIWTIGLESTITRRSWNDKILFILFISK